MLHKYTTKTWSVRLFGMLCECVFLFFPSVPVWSQVISAKSVLLILIYDVLRLCVWRDQGLVSPQCHLCGMFPGSLWSHRGPHIP